MLNFNLKTIHKTICWYFCSTKLPYPTPHPLHEMKFENTQSIFRLNLSSKSQKTPKYTYDLDLLQNVRNSFLLVHIYTKLFEKCNALF